MANGYDCVASRYRHQTSNDTIANDSPFSKKVVFPSLMSDEVETIEEMGCICDSAKKGERLHDHTPLSRCRSLSSISSDTTTESVTSPIMSSRGRSSSFRSSSVGSRKSPRLFDMCSPSSTSSCSQLWSPLSSVQEEDRASAGYINLSESLTDCSINSTSPRIFAFGKSNDGKIKSNLPNFFWPSANARRSRGRSDSFENNFDIAAINSSNKLKSKVSHSSMESCWDMSTPNSLKSEQVVGAKKSLGPQSSLRAASLSFDGLSDYSTPSKAISLFGHPPASPSVSSTSHTQYEAISSTSTEENEECEVVHAPLTPRNDEGTSSSAVYSTPLGSASHTTSGQEEYNDWGVSESTCEDDLEIFQELFRLGLEDSQVSDSNFSSGIFSSVSSAFGVKPCAGWSF